MSTKVFAWLGIIMLFIVFGFGVHQLRMLKIAHSSFENYYAFRGCTQLIERTPTMGVCRTSNGQTITIVQYQGKWYLQGDLPCDHGLCW